MVFSEQGVVREEYSLLPSLGFVYGPLWSMTSNGEQPLFSSGSTDLSATNVA